MIMEEEEDEYLKHCGSSSSRSSSRRSRRRRISGSHQLTSRNSTISPSKGAPGPLPPPHTLITAAALELGGGRNGQHSQPPNGIGRLLGGGGGGAEVNGCRRNNSSMPTVVSHVPVEVAADDDDDDELLLKEEPLPLPRSRTSHSAQDHYLNDALELRTRSCRRRNGSAQASFQDLISTQEQHDHFQEVQDDDDSDWEPNSEPLPDQKWFCTNCTMTNFEDALHCDGCGEHKESSILQRGFFASPYKQDSSSTESPAVADQQDTSRLQLAQKDLTVIAFDKRMLLHSEVDMRSHPHPERPDRIRAIAASFAVAGIFPGKCVSIPAREITREELGMVHSLEHVIAVESTSYMLSSYFTPDTYANEHSACAARLAAGLCADLATLIVQGQARNGFALVRPPGHHAGVKQAMGFCLHNNAAIAAMAAQAAGAHRVLIVDWDVHHGNGTQEIFDGSKSVLYVSLHRHEDGRFYPGTGAAEEVGRPGAEGFSVNIPWKRGGVGDNDYVFAFQQIVLPIALQFAPDLTIISAGFDAARGDPLGCCDVTPTGFGRMTHMLTSTSHGKLLVILEGGYNLRSISSSATAVVKVLLGDIPEFKKDKVVPTKAGLLTVKEVLEIQLKYWPNLEMSYNRVRLLWESSWIAKRKVIAKKKLTSGPLWWKWGRKRLLYHLLSGGRRRQRLKVSNFAKTSSS